MFQTGSARLSTGGLRQHRRGIHLFGDKVLNVGAQFQVDGRSLGLALAIICRRPDCIICMQGNGQGEHLVTAAGMAGDSPGSLGLPPLWAAPLVSKELTPTLVGAPATTPVEAANCGLFWSLQVWSHGTDSSPCLLCRSGPAFQAPLLPTGQW